MHPAIKTRVLVSDFSGSTNADSKLFGRYKREVKQPVRQLDVNESKVIDAVKVVWQKIRYDKCDDWRFPAKYKEVFELLKDINCSAKDVERFSIGLAEFQDERYFSDKAGTFLSAMINNSSDTHFIVYTKYLSGGTKEVRGIGHMNTKHITVEGNVANDVGWGMSSGKILVKGDANEFVGWGMVGGVIVIEGYASSAGERTIGGKIVIEKGLFRVGEEMGSGCEIHSFGKWPSHIIKGDVILGKVFHNGKLISPETERI